jgi:hypothetical protein
MNEEEEDSKAAEMHGGLIVHPKLEQDTQVADQDHQYGKRSEKIQVYFVPLRRRVYFSGHLSTSAKDPIRVFLPPNWA